MEVSRNGARLIPVKDNGKWREHSKKRDRRLCGFGRQTRPGRHQTLQPTWNQRFQIFAWNNDEE